MMMYSFTDTTNAIIFGITVAGVIGKIGETPIGIGCCIRSVTDFTSSPRIVCRHHVRLLSWAMLAHQCAWSVPKLESTTKAFEVRALQR